MRLGDETDWAEFPEFLIPGLVWKRNLLGGYTTKVGGKTWKLRLDRAADGVVYTLVIDGVETVNFTEWPSDWVKGG